MGEDIMSRSPRLAVSRRGMVCSLAAGAALWSGPAQAGIPASRRLTFEVFRNGKPIGAHVVTFEQAGDRLEVRVVLDLAVRWAGLVVYRYQTRGGESWRGGVLVSAQAETTDDHGRYAMRATRRDGRLLVEGTAGPAYAAPERSLVSSHWNPAQLRAPMISMQDGKLLEFRIAPRGRATIAARGTQLEADHFALTGPHTLDLWYDRQLVWSKLKAISWEGSEIEYRQI